MQNSLCRFGQNRGWSWTFLKITSLAYWLIQIHVRCELIEVWITVWMLELKVRTQFNLHMFKHMLRADFWGIYCLPNRRGLPGRLYTSTYEKNHWKRFEYWILIWFLVEFLTKIRVYFLKNSIHLFVPLRWQKVIYFSTSIILIWFM